MTNSSKKLKDFREWFDKYIEKNYGKRCKDFCWDCANCHAQFVKDIFNDFVENTIEIEEWFDKGNKKSKERNAT